MHVWNVLLVALWKYRTQKKLSYGNHRKICSAMSSQLRHVSRIGKSLLNSNIFSTSPRNMVNFGPLTAEICWWVWGTPGNFNRFRILASLLHRHRSMEVNRTLQDVWLSPGLVHNMYIFGGSCFLTEFFSAAKFTLRPSFSFSYLTNVTARHSSSGYQPDFVACYKDWNYGTFAEAPPIFGWAAIMLGSAHILVLIFLQSYCCLIIQKITSFLTACLTFLAV